MSSCSLGVGIARPLGSGAEASVASRSGAAKGTCPRWAHPPSVGLPQLSHQHPSEIDGKDTPAHRPQPDSVTDECFAHKTFAALPLYFSIAADTTARPSRWIFRFARPPANPAAGGPIYLRRRLLPQPLVRPDLVVMSHPTMGAPLLGSRRTRWGSHRFAFEHSM